MTAVMRSAAGTGPKVLRIGVVQGGRVIEERIVKQRSTVTVGPGERNTFVIPGAPVASFRLFELIGSDYHLNFLDTTQGRIALSTGVSELSVLKGQARRTSQGAYQIRLTEDARGKIVIGDTTLLFQFVAPPPVQPKPRLPVAVLRGSNSIDWNTTIIAAFSFLFHFLLLGAIYSDWLDPVVDGEYSVAGLVDTLKALPPPPAVEEKEEVSDEKAEKAEKAETPKATSAAPASKATGGQMSKQEAAAVANQLEQLEMATIGALSAAGPATLGVLKGEVALGSLDSAAQSGAGVGAGGDELAVSGAGGTLRPGQTGGLGLSGIGAQGKTEGTTGTGTAAKVVGPKGNANASLEAQRGGKVGNANAVVQRMRGAFRACYQKGLNENPDSQGTIRLTIQIGPGGEVSGVTAVPQGTLSPGVIACVKSRAQAAQFDPPDGGSAALVVPVTFVKQ
jgi:hypothetical protein